MHKSIFRRERGEKQGGGRKRRKELPEAPWVGAWRRPRRRSHHWRTAQRSGEAEGAAWEEGRSEGSPGCSYGTAHRPGVRRNEGQGSYFDDLNKTDKNQVGGNHF